MNFYFNLNFFDSHGYLIDYKNWNKCLAKYIAKKEGIYLIDKHWYIIFFIRRFYLKKKEIPTTRIVVDIMKKKYGPKIGDSRFLFHLFPKGFISQATKIAGLPKPTRCF